MLPQPPGRTKCISCDILTTPTKLSTVDQAGTTYSLSSPADEIQYSVFRLMIFNNLAKSLHTKVRVPNPSGLLEIVHPWEGCLADIVCDQDHFEEKSTGLAKDNRDDWIKSLVTQLGQAKHDAVLLREVLWTPCKAAHVVWLLFFSQIWFDFFFFCGLTSARLQRCTNCLTHSTQLPLTDITLNLDSWFSDWKITHKPRGTT